MQSLVVCFCLLFASAAVVMSVLGGSSGIHMYGKHLKPGKSVLKRIRETKKGLACEAHVLGASVKRSSHASLTITVNISTLPTHVNRSTLLFDELHLIFPNDAKLGNLPTSQGSEELWIKEGSTNLPLARVEFAKNKLLAIKLRGVFLEWLKEKQQLGTLKITLGQSGAPISPRIPSTYFVVYAYGLKSSSVPRPSKCFSHNVTITTGNDVKHPSSYRTKICTPREEITFPFGWSPTFDVGSAFWKSLDTSPIAKNAPVLRNPKCCQPTKWSSMKFFTQNGLVRLDSATVTECGCKVV